jgi:hypothetical protein
MGKALRRRERVVNLNQPALPGCARRQPPLLRAHVPLSSGASVAVHAPTRRRPSRSERIRLVLVRGS